MKMFKSLISTFMVLLLLPMLSIAEPAMEFAQPTHEPAPYMGKAIDAVEATAAYGEQDYNIDPFNALLGKPAFFTLAVHPYLHRPELLEFS